MRIQIAVFALVVLLGLTTTGVCQDPTPPEDLYGIELRQWLKDNWYNPWADVLGYSEAREEMYSYIDNESGEVYCVYSGFHQDAAFTSFLDPINCEHSVPQSFFNSMDPMKSDIHHLYPTHGDVNSARGNLPFAEVNDNQTDTWFNGDESDLYDQSNIPGVGIENYSELWINEGFEPREDHKGDLARSLFYFYTVYPTQAGSIDEIANLNTLYDWHINDPVDADELLRDDKIQEVQGNYNPYVRQADLAGRAWGFIFPSVEEHGASSFQIGPNPVKSELTVFSNGSVVESIEILDITGKLVLVESQNTNVDCSSLQSGFYLCSIHSVDGQNHRLQFVVE